MSTWLRRQARRKPDRCGEEGSLGSGVRARPVDVAASLRRLSVLALVASGMGTRSSLTLGLAALILWAVSWSWLVGVGVTVVRVGELGAIVAGLGAVTVGATTRPRSAGFWLGIVVLVLVIGLNVLGLILR